MKKTIDLIVLVLIIKESNAARILAVFPVPSISHQTEFRPLTEELAKRGHEVYVITTDPAYAKGEVPKNLIEIDVKDESYKIWNDAVYRSSNMTRFGSLYDQWRLLLHLHKVIFSTQIEMDEVKEILDKDFDLLIIEACVRPSLFLSYKLKIPVIQMSSFGRVLGITRFKIHNITTWEKLLELYDDFLYKRLYAVTEEEDNELLNQFDTNIPPLNKLRDTVHMFFTNVYPIFDNLQPVPPGVIYFGGSRNLISKQLPSDLKSFLDKSKHGVVYFSFGTNVKLSRFSADIIQRFINAFSQLPYDVVMKWDKDVLPKQTKNIYISIWFPQVDVLRHPNVKLFITQAGYQSTCESIAAGVPLIGIPILIDQWYNSEKYIHFGIGMKLDIFTLTEEELVSAVVKVISNESYRQNVVKFRTLLVDQPQRPLDRVVWWTEHVLRSGGARHLRAPAANMPWTEYYEVELICIFNLILLFLVYLTVKIVELSVDFFKHQC